LALLEKDMFLRQTEQVVNSERVETNARLTATQQVIDAAATEMRHAENLQATRRADSATEAAWQVTIAAGKAIDTATAQAAAIATIQADERATSTAQAQGTATQAAVVGLTATIEADSTKLAYDRTQEAPVVWAKGTAISAEAEKTVIELQKAKATMWASAWGGWLFGIICLALGAFVVWKKSQVGVISDGDGKVKILMIGKNALNPDLMFRPVIDFNNPKGGAVAPALGTSDEIQQGVTHDRMIVDAIKSLPPGYQRQAIGMAAGMNKPAAVNIQVVQPNQSGLITQWDEDIQAKMAQEVRSDD